MARRDSEAASTVVEEVTPFVLPGVELQNHQNSSQGQSQGTKREGDAEVGAEQQQAKKRRIAPMQVGGSSAPS
jgi:hypothetical protein